ncbi:acetolactate synthase [Rhodococcus sp. 05-2256-B2]|uniref:thiamine pyrophosphate-binding protein n=1 Tax=Nocardiaceae TaxID=85025 RepID=UPI00050C9857|nr:MULTISPECIES: thiamine pyrophosphate-binding protein [Rhodococcus]MBY4383771.1 thiamine pyrophosphate-binding protein [Rhodococcus fascians]MBY4398982.1 thiamine pyrophosphate-binding protein [Rhodococcus fascians]MBY4408520.1 thiamine pyrophosphate-binding protein [Rhodococcus fascians]MBY4423559.1 thiamine pyrophosphate-binding protein [Rhodococcus fascians]MBY4462917.1 thiamine pyrophosphate-binding protein [Rhodococcus fascians]
MNVAQAIGVALGRFGVRRSFGVVGSGNFHFTNGLVDSGVDFVATRHEGGAATMADSYSRMTGEVSVVSLHQGCGLTNAMTGLGEAAKSRTPLVVVVGEATDPASNFHVDQDAMVRSVGATSILVRTAETAVSDTRRAYVTALNGRRTVVLRMPLDVQEHDFDASLLDDLHPVPVQPQPVAAAEDIDAMATLLVAAQRPVFICGRGARGESARAALTALAETTGALLAEGAVAKGLFAGQKWAIDVSGGFSSPTTAALIADADVVVGWGSALNNWTTGHGTLIGPTATLIQVDLEASALGRHRPIRLGVVADVARTAEALNRQLVAANHRSVGYRTDVVAEDIATRILWRDHPYEDVGTAEAMDPRTLSIALDDALPADRVIGVDSGNFMGYPSMYLAVPNEQCFSFTQAFQSIGLGLSTAIGAALAQPDRFPVAACGDGGFLMGISELETLVRLDIKMLVVVYNDHAYGAEVHFFGPDGYQTDIVTFPETDIASIATGFGCDAITVRTQEDLRELAARVSRGLERPLVVDAKVIGFSSWWHRAAMLNH